MSQIEENIHTIKNNAPVALDVIVYKSSSYYKDVVVFNSENLKEKMILASRILNSCKQRKANEPRKEAQIDKNGPNWILEEVQQYTNLPIEHLKNIQDNMATNDKTFEDFFINISNQILAKLINDIRSVFIKFYLDTCQIPSKLAFVEKLKDKAVKYNVKDSDLTIQKLANTKLIKYHHFPAYNRYLLTEHPENVYNRTSYLKTLEEYRSQGRNIVYVNIRHLKKRHPMFTVAVAAMPNTNTLKRFLNKSVSRFVAEDWLKNHVLPRIIPGSVVVLCQPQVPKLTPYSPKRDFIVWLDRHNIPYDNKPHTSQLYSLYKTFEKNVKAESPYDCIFDNAGMDIVNFPGEWLSLDYFKSLWVNLNNYNEQYNSINIRMFDFKNYIKDVSEPLFQNMRETEQQLINEEKKIIKEDADMEMFLENLLEMIDNGEVNIQDFPEKCSGDKTAYFETHMSDFLINK